MIPYFAWSSSITLAGTIASTRPLVLDVEANKIEKSYIVSADNA